MRGAQDEAIEARVVTKREPTSSERAALQLAWNVCKHVKSNAIVFAKENRTVGIGAGQMSRVLAVEIASKKAGADAKNAVMASDAFFPFADGVQAAAEAGSYSSGSTRRQQTRRRSDRGVQCSGHGYDLHRHSSF